MGAPPEAPALNSAPHAPQRESEDAFTAPHLPQTSTELDTGTGVPPPSSRTPQRLQNFALSGLEAPHLVHWMDMLSLTRPIAGLVLVLGSGDGNQYNCDQAEDRAYDEA